MKYQGPLVDVDMHHTWKDDAELIEFLPREWREYAKGEPFLPQTRVAPSHANWIAGAFASNRSTRIEALPPDGSRPGSDYALLKRMLLDRYPYYRGMLTHQIGEYGAHLNPYYAQAVCRAANDWNLATWANIDERLYTVVVTPTGDPTVAAGEIRRVGGHPKVAAVLLCSNVLGRAYGDPIYHPIYEAATEMGLPVTIHISVGADRPNNQISLVGGPQSTGIENGALVHHAAMHFISSFIVNGVFEKFPKLKVLIIEYGVAWLPYVIWRLDQHYDVLKMESPWVKKWPSEYIREHIRVSTQPIEEGRDPAELITLLEAVDGIEDLLCFSTDFPHIASDEPSYVARLLPSSWHRKVFCDNACDVYGWKPPAADKVATVAAGARE